ncbi:HORMAD1 (predicted) [Pycnogonum litorale]
MTNTAQMTRPITNSKQIGSWSENFPETITTEAQSLMFVKKMVAIAISEITYLRAMFPEIAYSERSIEGLTVRILRDDKAYPGACRVVHWVLGCYDALQKNYLRQITLALFKDSDKPNNVFESYTFRFSYNNQSGVTILRNGSKVTDFISSDEIKTATMKLMRTISYLMQSLMDIPDHAYMTMKLTYYDEVTPEDYEPPGFVASPYKVCEFDEKTATVRIGNVATNYHSVDVRVTSAKRQFDQSQTQECSEDKQNRKIRIKNSQNNNLAGVERTKNTNCEDTKDFSQSSIVTEKYVSPERDESEVKMMTCPCNNLKSTSELMLECKICKTWQHGICYSILDVSQVPSNHVCYHCASADVDRQPTDPSLMGLPDVEVNAACLFRRTLALLKNKDRVQTTMLKKNLDVDTVIATALYNRLLSDGIIKKGRMSKNIDKDVLKEKIQNYFHRKQLANDNNSEVMKLKRKTKKKSVDATNKSAAKKRQRDSLVELDFSTETEDPKKDNKFHKKNE